MRLFIVLSFILINSAAIAQELTVQKYNHYALWIDCKERASIAFHYVVSKDTGNKARYHSFYDDPDLPQSCEQLSRDSYKHHSETAPKYDRGHLAAANHFDFAKSALKEANFMANVLPQTLQLNRGAWKRTEEIVECYRDQFDVANYGGVIWGQDSSDDHFITSHGVRTPDYYWRVLAGSKNGQTYFSAWILPNSKDARASNLKHYAVNLAQLVNRIKNVEVKQLLNSMPITSGKGFKYKKGCKVYES